jgi:CPA2 family monovalent cation:H+ antiporter-2
MDISPYLIAAAAGPADGEPSLGFEVLATLAVAAVVALVAQRFRLAAAPAFLLAGIAAGPGAIGVVSSLENLTEIGHVATMLLLFGIGLELRIDRSGNWGDGLKLTAAGAISCVAITLIGWPVAMAFGLTAGAALAVSMAMTLSSTALVLRTLTLRRELRRPHGRASLVVLIVQDLAALVMLAILPLLSPREGSTFGEMAMGAALSLGGVALLVVLGKLFAGRILKEAARGPEGLQLMTIVGVVMAVGAGLATQGLGLSPELGAFIAGFLLADTPFRHQIAGAVAPLRDVLLAVFFTSVGMVVDPALALEYWWVVLVAGAVVFVIKAIGITGSLWAMGSSASTSVQSGLSLAHGGEFSLVVLTAAAGLNVITPTTFALGVTVIVISLVLTPIQMRLGRTLAPKALNWPAAPWIKKRVDEAKDATETEDHVIIAGFGPVGRALAEQLDSEGVPFVVIDLNPDTVIRQESRGRTAVYGDATSAEVLESAGIHQAAALALTIPDDDAAVRACNVAIRLAPTIYIVARLNSLGKGNLARSSGAREVIVEEITAAKYVRDAVMKELASRKDAD